MKFKRTVIDDGRIETAIVSDSKRETENLEYEIDDFLQGIRVSGSTKVAGQYLWLRLESPADADRVVAWLRERGAEEVGDDGRDNQNRRPV